MGILIWLIVGGVVGWLASLIMRTDGQQGILLNIVVGIVGALLAGFLISPLVGAIPGPGGVFVFAAGLVLLLRNSRNARRQFAQAKRRWPRLGRWIDRGLRRESARRRRALEEQRSR